MAFTAANRYDFTGNDVTGTVDAHRSAGVWAAQLVLSGETLESTQVTRSDLGYEVRTVVKSISDGSETHLLVVLPRVNIEDEPVDFTSYAVLFTNHGNVAGESAVHGALESYDVRQLSGTASFVE